MRARVLSIAATVVLGIGIPPLAVVCTHLALHALHHDHMAVTDHVFVQHGVQLLLALVAIAFLKRCIKGDLERLSKPCTAWRSGS